MAYYYEAEEGSEMRELVTNFIVGNSLLSAAGFPMCGELDLKTLCGQDDHGQPCIEAALLNSIPLTSMKILFWWGMTVRII